MQAACPLPGLRTPAACTRTARDPSSSCCPPIALDTTLSVSRTDNVSKAVSEQVTRRNRRPHSAPAIKGNRAHLYHVRAKALQHAIGERDSRCRRTVPARFAGERLMRLDAALLSPDLEWLTTPSEKLAYLASRTA